MAPNDVDAGGEILEAHSRRARGQCWTILLFLCLYLVVAAGILAKPLDRSDYWVHLSVIRALAEGDAIEKISVHRNTTSILRLHDPYHALLALIMSRTALKWTNLLAAAALFNTALLFTGMIYLGRKLARRWTMPICLGMTVLFLWGTGYSWSNEIYFSILPKYGSYPSTLAWAISFFIMGLVLEWRRCGGIYRLLLAAGLSGLVITIHALTAVMFTLTFPVLWVWTTHTTWWKRALVLYPLPAVALSLLWPHNSLIGQLGFAHVGGPGANRVSNRILFWPDMPLALGPAWLGIVLVGWAPRRWRRPLVAGIIVYLSAWLGTSALGMRLSHRFVFFLGFVMQMAIAVAVERFLRIGLRRGQRHPALFRAVLTGAAVLLIPWAPLHLWRLGMIYNDRVRFREMTLQPSLVDRYESACLALRRALPEGAVVLVDPNDTRIFAAYGISAIPSRGLSQSPASSLDPDFLDSLVVSARKAGATHFVVDHILLDRDDLRPREAANLRRRGEVTRFSPEFTVLEFRGATGSGLQN